MVIYTSEENLLNTTTNRNIKIKADKIHKYQRFRNPQKPEELELEVDAGVEATAAGVVTITGAVVTGVDTTGVVVAGFNLQSLGQLASVSPKLSSQNPLPQVFFLFNVVDDVDAPSTAGRQELL